MGKRSRLVLIKTTVSDKRQGLGSENKFSGDENQRLVAEKADDPASSPPPIFPVSEKTCFFPSSANDDPCLQELDIFSIPEIVENIFKYLRQRRDLRACRLVNHLWNEEVCRHFRKVNSVRLYDRNLVHFERLLRGNGRLKLPVPFSHYKISIRKLDDRNLVKILNSYPKPVIKSCNFIVSQTATNSAYQKQLLLLLQKNGTNIEFLSFNMFRGIYLGYIAMTEGSLPLLPALQTLVIHNKARSAVIPPESINFLLQLINAAPNLRHFELICEQEDVLIELVTQGQWNSLQSFYSEGLTEGQLEALSNIHMPQLTKLHLKYNDSALHDENNVTGSVESRFRKLVQNFGATLVEMHVSWIGSSNRNLHHDHNNNNNDYSNDNNHGNRSNGFPHCPQLKILTLYLYEGPLTVINRISLPALEHFNLVEYSEFQSSDSEHETPHDGVTSFSMEDFSGLYLDQEFQVLVNFVDRQFPKLRSLSMYMVLNDESVRTIVTALPLLVQLELRTGPMVTEEAFTGVPLGINIEDHLKCGKNLKEIRVFPSLANMQYVTELNVSNFPAGPLISNAAIKYGLAVMPSLETLTMNWDSGYDVNTIAESLGHLRRLSLSDWHHVNPSSSIFYLKQIMPQLHIPGYAD